jgi:hypothetical protein
MRKSILFFQKFALFVLEARFISSGKQKRFSIQLGCAFYDDSFATEIQETVR